MKLLFTLLGFFALHVLSAQTTINETFENYASDAALTNNCWSFSGAGLATNSMVTGANSISVIPTTSNANGGNSNMGQMITPFVNLSAGTTLTFDLKLGNQLKGQGERSVNVRLLDINGTYSSVITSFTLNKDSDHTIIHKLNISMNITGVYRVVLDFYGGGDGNTYLYVDNMTYTYGFNYSPTYACPTYVQPAPLPIILREFNGSLNGNQVQLKWLVDENETGKHFQVQRSTNGIHFQDAALVFVSSKTGTEQYVYEEALPSAAGAYYRLQIVNEDHSITYSRIVSLKPASERDDMSKVTILQNPIRNNTLRFSFTSEVAESVQVVLFNLAGVAVYTHPILSQKGLNMVNLPLETELNYGTYILQLNSSTQRRAIKVTK